MKFPEILHCSESFHFQQDIRCCLIRSQKAIEYFHNFDGVVIAQPRIKMNSRHFATRATPWQIHLLEIRHIAKKNWKIGKLLTMEASLLGLVGLVTHFRGLKRSGLVAWRVTCRSDAIVAKWRVPTKKIYNLLAFKIWNLSLINNREIVWRSASSFFRENSYLKIIGHSLISSKYVGFVKKSLWHLNSLSEMIMLNQSLCKFAEDRKYLYYYQVK